MISLEELARIAEIEFYDIVEAVEKIGTKLRIMLIQEGFIDVWVSKKIKDRFGFHWEQKNTKLFYRYDNFPNTKWKHISSFPYHFHDGSQENVIESSQFEKDIKEGFRAFLMWVRSELTKSKS